MFSDFTVYFNTLCHIVAHNLHLESGETSRWACLLVSIHRLKGRWSGHVRSRRLLFNVLHPPIRQLRANQFLGSNFLTIRWHLLLRVCHLSKCLWATSVSNFWRWDFLLFNFMPVIAAGSGGPLEQPCYGQKNKTSFLTAFGVPLLLPITQVRRYGCS